MILVKLPTGIFLCDLGLPILTCQQGMISRYLETEGVEISGLVENDLLSNLRT